MIIVIAALTLSSSLAFGTLPILSVRLESNLMLDLVVILTLLIRENKKMDQEGLDALCGSAAGEAIRKREAACLEGIEIEEAIGRRKRFKYFY